MSERPSSNEGKSIAGISRRDLFRYGSNSLVTVCVLGAAVWTVTKTYAQQLELLDLAAIGNGIPTIVQVHDPGCPTCSELQKRTLRAAAGFPDGSLQIRVANIRSLEGRAIADRYGVPHVTLLLFDGKGEMQTVLRGLLEVDYLRNQFALHIERSASSS